jgi:hypothetical protein
MGPKLTPAPDWLRLALPLAPPPVSDVNDRPLLPLLLRRPDAAAAAACAPLLNDSIGETGTVEKLLSLGVVLWLLPSALAS